jgi:hypothetical protein
VWCSDPWRRRCAGRTVALIYQLKSCDLVPEHFTNGRKFVLKVRRERSVQSVSNLAAFQVKLPLHAPRPDRDRKNIRRCVQSNLRPHVLASELNLSWTRTIQHLQASMQKDVVSSCNTLLLLQRYDKHRRVFLCFAVAEVCIHACVGFYFLARLILPEPPHVACSYSLQY